MRRFSTKGRIKGTEKRGLGHHARAAYDPRRAEVHSGDLTTLGKGFA